MIIRSDRCIYCLKMSDKMCLVVPEWLFIIIQWRETLNILCQFARLKAEVSGLSPSNPFLFIIYSVRRKQQTLSGINYLRFFIEC